MDVKELIEIANIYIGEFESTTNTTLSLIEKEVFKIGFIAGTEFIAQSNES